MYFLHCLSKGTLHGIISKYIIQTYRSLLKTKIPRFKADGGGREVGERGREGGEGRRERKRKRRREGEGVERERRRGWRKGGSETGRKWEEVRGSKWK